MRFTETCPDPVCQREAADSGRNHDVALRVLHAAAVEIPEGPIESVEWEVSAPMLCAFQRGREWCRYDVKERGKWLSVNADSHLPQ